MIMIAICDKHVGFLSLDSCVTNTKGYDNCANDRMMLIMEIREGGRKFAIGKYR
jgi:hypothetical protein